MRIVPIEDSFDLHSFLPTDVASALAEYLDQVRERGLREVRIIHGKGSGVRRAQVRRFLERRKEIADFFDAPPERGGSGATVAILAVPIGTSAGTLRRHPSSKDPERDEGGKREG